LCLTSIRKLHSRCFLDLRQLFAWPAPAIPGTAPLGSPKYSEVAEREENNLINQRYKSLRSSGFISWYRVRQAALTFWRQTSRLFINFLKRQEVPSVQRAFSLLDEPPKWHIQIFGSSASHFASCFWVSDCSNTDCVNANYGDISIFLFYFLPGFPPNNLYPYLISPMRAARLAPPTLLNLITFIIIGEKIQSTTLFNVYFLAFYRLHLSQYERQIFVPNRT
jgi:hypothetical protein